MYKISIDFDCTLSRRAIQEYAKDLIHRGFEIWIVTARQTSEDYCRTSLSTPQFCAHINDELFEVAEECGIPFERIQFMNGHEKYHFLRNKDFIFHLDDDTFELREINRNTHVTAISSLAGDWKAKCERAIKLYIKDR